MLHPFVSSRASRPHQEDVGGLSASVVAHAGLVVFAVVVTAVPEAPERVVRSLGVERIAYTHVTPSADERPARTAARVVRRGAVAALPRVVRAPLVEEAEFSAIEASLAALVDAAAIDVAVGVTDFATAASEGLEFDRDALREHTGAPRALKRLAGGAYAESDVEKVVAAFGTNPRPYYPLRLQWDNIESTFTVRFVVDSTGRVDRRSFEFPPTAHRLFVKAVRDALLRSRFLPAELGGRRVAQMVQQRFSFILHRD
jgi:periplasmic protein TonB